jgi:predicted DNA-binding transcriptional regulator YafY
MRGLHLQRLEPQFLYLNVPVWYLLAWDRLRGAVRFFRIDRVRSVTPLEAGFRVADPKPFLAEAEEVVEALEQHRHVPAIFTQAPQSGFPWLKLSDRFQLSTHRLSVLGEL